jgi:molecular chaperone DnaK (HSP70)
MPKRNEKRFKEIETRNAADSMIYQADKTLKDFAGQVTKRISVPSKKPGSLAKSFGRQ